MISRCSVKPGRDSFLLSDMIFSKDTVNLKLSDKDNKNSLLTLLFCYNDDEKVHFASRDVDVQKKED